MFITYILYMFTTYILYPTKYVGYNITSFRLY